VTNNDTELANALHTRNLPAVGT